MPKTVEQKRRDILNRIESLREAIENATEYLETGKHADWSGFRAMFVQKVRDGKELSPHKEWVKNVLLPRQKKELARAERLLERLRED